MENIENILFDFNIEKDDYELYGKNIAKINASNFKDFARKGKLIVMTSINPTPAGEGKTTTAIGLTDGLNFIGKDAILALREPSLGPVFGRKGTATGGGKSQVIPNDEINLHFTGDIHAITTANNLISAAIDSAIYWNEIDFDLEKIYWNRCLDLNDRSLRSVDIKITNQISRKEHFNITAASNMMTILSLAKDEQDLRKRIESSLVGMTNSSKPVFAKDLKVVGSVMAILKNAIKPNFVRTQYDSPVLVHCGPFANIAIGTNSIISTDLALKLGEYAVIETGFGSDLGFEKFMNLVNYQYDLVPDCVVLVVTVRALELQNDFKNNFEHLKQHLEHINLYKLNLVIAINKIEGDDELKLKSLKAFLTSRGYNWSINDAYSKGPKGAENLAKIVDKICERKVEYTPLVNKNMTIFEKISSIAKNFYYLSELEFSYDAKQTIIELQESKFQDYPICMVKSHVTIDGNDTKSSKYKMKISKVSVNTGGKFILIFSNQVMSMPGLNKNANFKSIDLVDGEIINLK